MAAPFVAVGIRFARPRARAMALKARDSIDDAARCIRGGRQPPPQICPAGDASRVRFLVRGKCLCGDFRETRRARRYSDLRAPSVTCGLLGGEEEIRPGSAGRPRWCAPTCNT